MARDALGDPAAAGRALERALDLAEPDGLLSLFLLHPAPSLLERYGRHLTAHASLLAKIISLLAGETPASPTGGPQPLLDPVSKSELRVLRYLPTHLTAQEIAGELYVSADAQPGRGRRPRPRPRPRPARIVPPPALVRNQMPG